MKNIHPMVDYINDSLYRTSITEAFAELLDRVKRVFKQAWAWARGVVVKAGSYIIPVNNEGALMPAITPMTAGQAYKDHEINRESTFVHVGAEGSRITGLRNKPEDARTLYGPGNSLMYWNKMLNEGSFKQIADVIEKVHFIDENNIDEFIANINEVKLGHDDPESQYNIIADGSMLEKLISSRIKNPTLTKLMIWGAPGIGKTAILEAVVKEVRKEDPNYNFIVKTLSNETPDNFSLPAYKDDGQGGKIAIDIPKSWLPVYKPTGDSQMDKELDEKCGRGLMFIDELSRATPQVLNVILPLINENRYNEYKLGSGWTIITASNRMEDELAGQTNIGNALGNRFAQVYFEPTFKSWESWAKTQNYISPLLLTWLGMPDSGDSYSGAKFYYMDPNENSNSITPSTIMCSPRSWTNAMRELAVFSYTGNLEGFTIFDIDIELMKKILNMYVPAAAVDSFMAFLSVLRKLGNLEHAVDSVWKNKGTSMRLDNKEINRIALPIAQILCIAHGKSLPTTEEWESMATWLVNQGSDQLAAYILDIFTEIFVRSAGITSELTTKFVFLGKWMVNTGTNVTRQGQQKNSGDFTEQEIMNYVEPVMKKFGVRWEDFPDYTKGLVILQKKYQSVFKQYMVDGMEGTM